MAQHERENLPVAGIGILGGTGLYEVDGIRDIEERILETPFGQPTDAYIIGTLEGKKVAFLSRHGRGHRFLPSDINFRANIYGFKMLGVERVISVNSCGSLKEEIRPRDIVFSDQFFDRTRRVNTFFGGGIAAHISFAQPVCPVLSESLYAAGKELGLRVHRGGTYLCIEGPAFSTKAESSIYRLWGCDVIGMTSATEAKLCREAEMCYATMNLVTDYDVWHAEEETVSVELILENLRLNIEHAKTIIKKAVASLPAVRGEECGCGRALENCIVTQAALIPPEVKKQLYDIIAKYIRE
ncbi:MAG: S-methyl-5'-thioadenosine phosphorylase [Clostridiales bacterium]|nr:S-methyl-5'-thioadenosine phosphorylase [Clostridiales bacterium]